MTEFHNTKDSPLSSKGGAFGADMLQIFKMEKEKRFAALMSFNSSFDFN